MMNFKVMFAAAIIGHIICGFSDRMMIDLPNGKFGFELMKDNAKLQNVFADLPAKRCLTAALSGIFAMGLFFFGYIAVYFWMKQYSEIAARLILISIAMIFPFGTVHHLLCGLLEWLYVKLERTEEARLLITELFQKTSITMIVCYIGFLLFGITLFVMVVLGKTGLAAWVCVFNIVPLMIILFALRIGGAVNWAGVMMFLGLLFFI